MFVCSICGEDFHDEWLLVAHKELFHFETEQTGRASVIQYAQPTNNVQSNTPSVIQFTQPSTSRNNLNDASGQHSFSSSLNLQAPPEIVAEAFEGKTVRHYRMKNNQNLNLTNFFSGAKEIIRKLIQKELKRLNFIKFGLVLDTTFVNIENETSLRSFITKNKQIMVTSNVSSHIEDCFEEIEHKITEHEGTGSGWSLLNVVGMNLRIHKNGYGERGSSFVTLPKKIQNTKSCVNVQNTDNECFKYAMLCKFLENDPNANRPCEKYNRVSNKYNFTGLQYPVAVKDIVSFETKNPRCSVNVFGLDDYNNVYPIKVVKEEKRDHTDLLLIKNGDISHYVYIKNFDRLIQRQVTKYHGKITICKRCLCFTNIKSVKSGNEWIKYHSYLCGKQQPMRTIIPHASHSLLKFEKLSHQYRIPIVLYCDLEASLLPVELANHETTSQVKYQFHEPNSYCLLLKSSLTESHLNDFGLTSKPYVYRGENVIKRFVDHLYNIAHKVSALYNYKLPMKTMTNAEIEQHNNATFCFICKSSFTTSNIKVREHDHLTGMYRGPACNRCNINYKLPPFINVVLHNLSKYDGHLLVPELGRDNGAIDVLATTSETFISFSKKVGSVKLRFIDSFRFLPSSLMSLSENLTKSDLKETQKLVPPEKIDLVLRKGVFPYDYIDCLARFQETCLPPHEAFYNKLNETHISKEDYAHACKVWRELKFRNLGEYSDFYVTLDVTLLADIFEEFRNTSFSAYGLDPLWSYTSPGFAWQAMLKSTKCELQLLTDIDMILMVENGVRGGMTQTVMRHVEANNKYITNYDSTKESIFIAYFDANNQYGWAQSNELPYGDFKWIDPNSLGDILQIPKHGDKGYILQFDFDYPATLHDLHYDLPLLPTTMIPPNGKFPKLMMTVDSKSQYIAHFWIVQQALQMGVKLTKIHRVLEFSQRRWLEPYITANTQRRANAKSAFQKNFYKLMNNSVFGKCLENKRKHKNIKLVTCGKKLLKLVQKSNFQTSVVINENLVAVSMGKTVVKMDRPLYVGMCILDISKVLMYDFHYNKMVNYYGRNNIGISYMDTDSFVYWIKTEDMYKDLRVFPYRDDFDFADYPKNHPTYDNGVNNKVLGKFTDECSGTPIAEIVALMPKMYAIRLHTTDGKEETNDNVIKKAKGIKTNYIKKHIMFNDYKKCLFANITYSATYNTIRSFNHQLFSITETKTSLSTKDNKRKIMQDGVHTLPYGHYSIK